MKIATWNVNSLKVRLPHVLDWLRETNCDVLGLQELKQDNAANEKVIAEFSNLGYHFVFNGQKTYNGVALISKYPIEEVVLDMANYADEQKRVITATINGIRIICAYFVNGEGLDSPKFQYKLAWLNALNQYVKSQLVKYPNLVLIGDYNIAPQINDTYNPEVWEGNILCSPEERAAFHQLLELGLCDSFRRFNQEEKQFSWWDYRNFAFRRNHGLRIDHILVANQLMTKAVNCVIDKAPRKLERPSDHTPVVLTLSL